MNRFNQLHLLIISLLIFSSVYCLQDLQEEINDLHTMFNFQKSQKTITTITNINQDPKTQGTQGFYLSPHAIGKQIQVSEALNAIVSKINISKTTYNHSSNIYVLDNFTIDLEYNDGKQKIQILESQKVTVSGGTVFFGYRFNYSITGPGKNVSGYGLGSIYSDSLIYKKQFTLNNASELQWQLSKIGGYNNLTMSNNRMKIKRIQPFNQTDLDALEEMMDRAFQSIEPSNIQHQFLNSFNVLFPRALNQSLNHQVFNRKVDYTFNHHTKGPLNLTLSRSIWNFAVDKNDGYRMIFVTEIDGHKKQTTCNTTVPYKQEDFNIYGGIQTLTLNCLYQDVVNYIQAQGWLDTTLNSDWQVNAFQFYAGDLFDMMNSLYTRVNPRSILEGQCKADRKNLVLKTSPQIASNEYVLKIDYNCTVRTTSKTAQTLDILQFVAETRFYIKVYADKVYLNFEISDAEVMSLSFTIVNNFIVTNMNLALFKATQVIRKNLNTKVFGTGFPTIPRWSPKTRLDKDKVLFYDASAFNFTQPTIDFTMI